jgi:hypothetical protein
MENRYEAGEARLFVGDSCVGGDFAVVCVSSRRVSQVGQRRKAWFRDRSRQDAAAGRGKPRPYKGLDAGAGRAPRRDAENLAGDCEPVLAGEVAGAGLVAVDFAEAFAQAFAGFVHLGF